MRGGRGDDMLDTYTMEACRRLVALYNGVTVEKFRAHPSGAANIVLRITDAATVARLAHCALQSNVAVLVWADSRGVSEEDWASPDRIRFELRAESASGDEPELSVVILCICMAEELAKLGRLDSEEAARLRTGWGF